MTKSEAILDKVCTGEMEIGDNVYTASEALQAQRTTAIEFAEWTAKGLWTTHSGMWYEYRNEDNPITSEQLFEIFNNQS